MQPITVKMQARGVLTLPKKMRDKIGLSDGVLVDIDARDGEIVVRPASRLDPAVLADVHASLEDLRAGRVSPLFSSVKEFKEYMKAKRTMEKRSR